jgi:ketosteroid isomerase-like protein
MPKSIIEIEQLLYRCCHAVDQGNIDNIMSVFHPNATLMINWEENGKYSGHEEIRQWFLNYTHVMKSTMKYLRHKIMCPLIEVNGDEATAFSYLDVDAAPKDTGQVIITVCRYEDKLTKLEGQWYLKEKSIFMDDTYTVMN